MCPLTGFVSTVLERNIFDPGLYQGEGLSTLWPNQYQSFNRTVVMGFIPDAIIFTYTKSDNFILASWHLYVWQGVKATVELYIHTEHSCKLEHVFWNAILCSSKTNLEVIWCVRLRTTIPIKHMFVTLLMVHVLWQAFNWPLNCLTTWTTYSVQRTTMPRGGGVKKTLEPLHLATSLAWP